MELLPLILIPVIYFGIAFLKPRLQRHLPFNLCAICVAVSSTWLALLILWLTNVHVSTIMLGILIGMSLTGVMYKLEGVFKNHWIKNFWFVRLVIILGGLYAAWLGLETRWRKAFLALLISLFAIVIASLLFQKDTRNSSIKRHLDNCC